MEAKEKSKKLSNEILLSQLQERYHSMHLMRERIQTLSLRILWILLWVSWWLTQNKLSFNCCEKTMAILIACVLFWIFIEYFLDLKSGFDKQLKTAQKIESELWLYKWKNPILEEFKNKNEWNRSSLWYHYLLMWFWFIVLFVCILHFT